jgi:sphinganine-1-phosphate aldolase
VFEIGSDSLDMDAVADALADRGWFPNRQPGGLHLMLSPHHATVVDALVLALEESVAEVRAGRTGSTSVAAYGAV